MPYLKDRNNLDSELLEWQFRPCRPLAGFEIGDQLVNQSGFRELFFCGRA